MNRIVALVCMFALAVPAFGEEPAWKAGFGKTAITPDQPMWMSGYASRTAPAEGKETDLWAKAAVLRDTAGHTAILVTLDLVGIDRNTSREICTRIEKKYGVPREAIALAMSHTHCGPVVRSNLRTMYALSDEQSKRVDEYGHRLPDKVLRAVEDAMGHLKSAKLSWAVGQAGFAVNRRENKEAQVPALRAQGKLKGPTDHDVPVLAVHDTAGKLLGVVFGYACHATVLSYQKWCGDYPGFAAIDLEKAHPGAVALFVAGCGADQNPLPRRTVVLAKGYGKQLADAVEAVLKGTMQPIAPMWTGSYHEIALPLREVPTREALLQEAASKNKYIAARAKMLLKKLADGGDISSTYPYPIEAWQLGQNLTLVILGGEVVVDYSLRLKKELGPNTWLIGYANDVMAYIPSLRVLKEGGYEGATSMIYYGLPSIWGSRIEELIDTEALRQARTVRGK